MIFTGCTFEIAKKEFDKFKNVEQAVNSIFDGNASNNKTYIENPPGIEPLGN